MDVVFARTLRGGCGGRDHNLKLTIDATDAFIRTTNYTYDKAGRRKTVADPRPVMVNYTYAGLRLGSVLCYIFVSVV